MSADTGTGSTTSEPNLHPRSIVVLGAGVIGLTIAHVLSDDQRNKITIVARELPGEHLLSQGWSSPWAGANWSPLGAFDERKLRWEKATFEKLWCMIPSGLVMELPSRVYAASAETERANEDLWWKGIVRDLRVIPKSELAERFTAGLSFTTVSLKPAEYLQWLRNELEQRGVSFIHKHVASIEETATLGGPDCVVVNATGLGSKSLLGVEDRNVYPIRGQTIIVDAPHVREFLAVASAGYEPTYIIPRPDGTCILGGTYQDDNYDVTVDNEIAKRIYERCTALEPGLLPDRGAKILSLNVGLRPARRGGPRVELETIQLPLESDLVPFYGDGTRPIRKVNVIHAYGIGSVYFAVTYLRCLELSLHSPAGYQGSWGIANEVADILSKI